MTSKNFDFEQTIGYTRKKFGATPDRVTDPSQIPTVKIGNTVVNSESDHSPNGPLHISSVAPVASSDNGQSTKPQPTHSVSSTNEHLQRAPVTNTATAKHVSSRPSIDKVILNMKIKTSADCLRMYYLIHDLSKEFENTWIEIARSDFENNGVRQGRLVSAREEGVERQLFEYREIKELNKQKKEYIKGYEYRLITK